MTVLFYLIGLAVALGIGQILLLWGACRMLGAQRATISRAAGVYITMLLAQAVWLAALLFIQVPVLQFLIAVGGGVGLLILNIWLINSWLVLSKWRSVGAWLLSGVAYSLLSAGIGYGARHSVAEAFKIPTNSMAPAILGRHQRGQCPACRGPLIVSVYDREPYNFNEAVPRPGICLDCQVSAEVTQVAAKIHSGDRVMADKTTAPRRWDVVVFRRPIESDDPYAKRLVGLPGDTIELRDETVFINGHPVRLPDEISKLHYYPPVEFAKDAFLRDGVVTLRDDEYVVLGDNSKNAMDSRYFGPIKSADIIGVVTLTYWPVSRWRVWR